MIPVNIAWFFERDSPFLDDLDDYTPQYMKGSIIPELIINQQGWIAATAQMIWI